MPALRILVGLMVLGSSTGCATFLKGRQRQTQCDGYRNAGLVGPNLPCDYGGDLFGLQKHKAQPVIDLICTPTCFAIPQKPPPACLKANHSCGYPDASLNRVGDATKLSIADHYMEVVEYRVKEAEAAKGRSDNPTCLAAARNGVAWAKGLLRARIRLDDEARKAKKVKARHLVDALDGTEYADDDAVFNHVADLRKKAKQLYRDCGGTTLNTDAEEVALFDQGAKPNQPTLPPAPPELNVADVKALVLTTGSQAIPACLSLADRPSPLAVEVQATMVDGSTRVTHSKNPGTSLAAEDLAWTTTGPGLTVDGSGSLLLTGKDLDHVDQTYSVAVSLRENSSLNASAPVTPAFNCGLTEAVTGKDGDQGEQGDYGEGGGGEGESGKHGHNGKPGGKGGPGPKVEVGLGYYQSKTQGKLVIAKVTSDQGSSATMLLDPKGPPLVINAAGGAGGAGGNGGSGGDGGTGRSYEKKGDFCPEGGKGGKGGQGGNGASGGSGGKGGTVTVHFDKAHPELQKLVQVRAPGGAGGYAGAAGNGGFGGTGGLTGNPCSNNPTSENGENGDSGEHGEKAGEDGPAGPAPKFVAEDVTSFFGSAVTLAK